MNSKLLEVLENDRNAKLCDCCGVKLTWNGRCVPCWPHVRPCKPDEGGEG